MSRKVAYIGIGSNTGNRQEWLRRAVRMLDRESVRLCRMSAVYETAPMYVEDQPSFLNGVVEVTAFIGPLRLLRRLRAVESALGRVRTIRNGPRTIDLDLLLYGNLVLNTPELELPHPRMAERRFVLEPLAELAPGLRHPRLYRSVEELLAVLPAAGSALPGDIGLTAALNVGQE